MRNGIIKPDSARGWLLGFTHTKFEGYLFKEGKRVYISLIVSLYPGKGHFREVVRRIHARGWTVAVPTPVMDMKRIVRVNGYTLTHETDAATESEAEVWLLPPPPKPPKELT